MKYYYYCFCYNEHCHWFYFYYMRYMVAAELTTSTRTTKNYISNDTYDHINEGQTRQGLFDSSWYTCSTWWPLIFKTFASSYVTCSFSCWAIFCRVRSGGPQDLVSNSNSPSSNTFAPSQYMYKNLKRIRITYLWLLLC